MIGRDVRSGQEVDQSRFGLSRSTWAGLGGFVGLSAALLVGAVYAERDTPDAVRQERARVARIERVIDSLKYDGLGDADVVGGYGPGIIKVRISLGETCVLNAGGLGYYGSLRYHACPNPSKRGSPRRTPWIACYLSGSCKLGKRMGRCTVRPVLGCQTDRATLTRLHKDGLLGTNRLRFI